MAKSKSLLVGLVLVLVSLSFSVVAQGYGESPMLKELAEAGKLPPVAERLPTNPVVVEPVERIGDYGGTIRASSIAADSLLGPPIRTYTTPAAALCG